MRAVACHDGAAAVRGAHLRPSRRNLSQKGNCFAASIRPRFARPEAVASRPLPLFVSVSSLFSIVFVSLSPSGNDYSPRLQSDARMLVLRADGLAFADGGLHQRITMNISGGSGRCLVCVPGGMRVSWRPTPKSWSFDHIRLRQCRALSSNSGSDRH